MRGTRSRAAARRLPVLVVAMMAAGACASTGQAPTAGLAGCWYFERDSVARSLRLPWGVRVSRDSLEGWPAIRQRGGVRVAATLTVDGDTDHPFGYWLPLAGDSVEIGYPGGGGYTLTAAVKGPRMEGTIRAVGDVMTPGTGDLPDPRPVVLTRALCPEP